MICQIKRFAIITPLNLLCDIINRKEGDNVIFGKHINKFYLKYWYLIVVGVAALILVDVVQLEIPNIVGSIVRGLNKYTDETVEADKLTIEALKLLVIRLPMIAIAMFCGRFLWRITIFNLGVKVESDLRDEMFLHSCKLSREYYNTHKVGEDMALYTNDLQAVKNTFSNGILTLVDCLFLGLYSFYKMYNVHNKLAFLALIPLSLIAAMSFIIGKILRAKFKARQEAYSELSDFTQENFSGITVVKAFVKEQKELSRFKKINKKNRDKNLEHVRFSMLLWIGMHLLINLIFVLIIAFSGVFRSQDPNSFHADKVIEFILYFETIIWPMMAISRLIDLRSQGKTSLIRVSEMLDYEVEIRVDNPVDVNIEGEIKFNNLCFKYPGRDMEVLHNINLDIPKGTLVGILGRTGCGKTTMVDLLLHLYNVERNTILIDGVDLMDIDLHKLRESIGYVPQDNFLFSKTIEDNICFGLKENNLEVAKEYAEYAAVADNIEDFPAKYDTLLGERGVTLSGGQRQRVSIARAMIKNPPILIMDDSVSAVDTETEEKIIGYLREKRAGKTTIVVAHRISTVKDLDMIIVLEEGKIIAQGSHEELLATSKVYQDMVLLQQLDSEEGGVE